MLEQRSASRALSPSTYGAHVLLAHLRAAPPMPIEEFQVLKRVVSELEGVRGLLRAAIEGDHAVEAAVSTAVQTLLPVLKRIREDVQTTLEVHSKSWEAPDA